MDQCNKKSLRKEYLFIRNNLSNRDIKSNKIVDIIKNTKEFKEAKSVGFFKHIGSEVDIDELIIDSLNNEKEVYLPKVLDDYSIEFYKIENINDLSNISKYGIEEPNTNIKSFSIDLIIIPGIVFDKRGYRIGYGKAYYDRYLLDKTTFKMGVCFKECLIDYIENDEHDIKMDMVITD